MKPDSTRHLSSLREEIAGLSIVKCRMSHERVLSESGSMLPVKSKLFPGCYERIGLCSPELRAQRLGCSHTSARVRLATAVDELSKETDQATAWSQELNYLDNEIHLLDHRKGEAEAVLARTTEELFRATQPGMNAKLAQTGNAVHEMERLHDDFVTRMGKLRDNVLAEIDRLMSNVQKSL